MGLSVILVVWFGVVFLFSSQTGRESSKTSDKVTRRLLGIVEGGCVVTTKQVDEVELYVRKAAHFGLFAAGGILIYALASSFSFKNKAFISVFVGMALACLDEFHQLYSLNRGPSFFDVGIDTAGVICGVMVAMIGFKLAPKIGKKYREVKKGYDKLQRNHRKKDCKSS